MLASKFFVLWPMLQQPWCFLLFLSICCQACLSEWDCVFPQAHYSTVILALANVKSVFMTWHILMKLSLANSPLLLLRIFSGRPYTLIRIWNIFWMIISGFFDNLTVVVDVVAFSVIWGKLFIKFRIHRNAFEKSRCPWELKYWFCDTFFEDFVGVAIVCYCHYFIFWN